MPDWRGVLIIVFELEKYVLSKCEQSEKTNLCIWYSEISAIKQVYDFGLIDKK